MDMAVTSGGQEYGIPIGASDLESVHAVKGRTRPGATLPQFILLFLGRHAPRGAPVDVGGIVLGVKFHLVIDKAVIAFGAIVAIFRCPVVDAAALDEPLVVARVIIV